MNSESNKSHAALPIATLLEIDAVCRRYESAWKAGQQPSLEAYLDGVSEPAQRVAAGIGRDRRGNGAFDAGNRSASNSSPAS